MKKILLFASALAGLFLAGSCQKEKLEVVADGTVTITVEAPGAMNTKAIADGTNVNEVHYAVYKTNPGEDYSIDDSGAIDGPLAQGVVEMSNKRASVEFDLLQDQNYTVIFWAQVAGAGHYELGDLRTISVNHENGVVDGNDETRAAFFARFDFSTFEHEDHTVTLRRPFAQLNLLTTPESLAPVQQGQTAGYTIDVKTSEVKVIGLGTSFNTLTGVAPAEDATILYEMAATPEEQGQETLSVNGKEYHYVSMNYLFVPEEEKLVDIEYTVATDKGNISHEIVAVPVKENYRTNVIGNLLTKETTFEIIVDANFEDSEDVYEGGKFGVVDGQKYVRVDNAAEFNAYVVDDNYDIIILNDNVVLTEVLTRAAADASLKVSKGKTLTIDLNGKTISATSAQTGKNYNMFDVNGGTLTVKNGTLEYKHEGSNMGWNNSTNIFNVTAGGVLNLDGVTAKNLGGSDMAFVAHLNNWGEVTLNVENSTLESTYIPVRVFNSGNDMNNVTIKNTTLNGKYCFWVHNYTVADFGTQEKADAHAALLNFDIFNGTNTFEYTGKAPVLYGFTDAIYFDSEGNNVGYVTLAATAEELQAAAEAAVAGDVVNTIYLAADIQGDATILQKEGANVVINGKGYKYDGVISVCGDARAAGAETLTFKNINFETEGSDFTFITAPSKMNDKYNYSHNVTVENCTFTGNHTVGSANFVGPYHFVMKNCTATNMHSILQVQSCDNDVLVDGVTVVGCKNGLSFGNTAYPTLKNSTISAAEYGVRADANASRGNLVIENTTLAAEKPVIVRKTTTAGYVLNVAESTVLTTSELYQVVFTKGSDDADYVAPEVEFTYNIPAVYNVFPLAEGVAVNVSTDAQVREMLKAGNDVILVNDITTTDAESNGYGATGININGGVFDGNGHTIEVEGATSTWDSAIAIKGGTIKNVTVAKGFRGIFFKNGTEKIVLENVTVKGPTYTISCDQAGKQGLEAYNSKFYGWTSYAATLGTVYFEGCTFGKGAGYNFSRPYAPTTYVNCTFEAGHAIDARAAVSFENCTFNGVALTSENINTLVTGNSQNVKSVK